MSAQRLRWLLRSAAAALLLLSVALVVWALQMPQSSDEANVPFLSPERSGVVRTQLVHSPPLEDLAQVWGKRLRRPLFDLPSAAKPPRPNVARKPQPRPAATRQVTAGGVKLVGTMMEDGRSKAIFMNSNGEIDVKGDGETLAFATGIRVDHIELHRVTVTNEGRLTTLQLPQTKTP